MERQFPVKAVAARRGFSLVELLVVMAIIAILLGIAVPALTSLTESSNLARSGQVVADEINLARQFSASKNVTVELRLFKLAGATTSGYTALQLFTSDSTGAMQAVSRLAVLPKAMAISENTTLSSALGATAFATPSTMPTGAGPTAGATYLPFQFRPSGVVTPVLNANGLANLSAYCLAIVPARFAASTLSSLPKNYVIIQINPVTATPLIYRP